MPSGTPSAPPNGPSGWPPPSARWAGSRPSRSLRQRRADTAAEELDRTQKFLTVAERSILEPAEAHAGDKRERRRRPRATVDSLEGLERRWWHGLFLKFLVLMAAVGDVVTFNVTLSAFFTDSGPMVLWGLTLALAAASVGLMHTAGHALRNLREGRGGHGRPAVVALVLGWLVIGAVAVAFRIQVATPVTSQQSAFGTDTTAEAAIGAHDALLSAILLGGLFIGSGLLAFYAGFSEHHPRMKTYLSVRKQLPKKHESATRLALEAETVRQSLEHVRGEADRARHACGRRDGPGRRHHRRAEGTGPGRDLRSHGDARSDDGPHRQPSSRQRRRLGDRAGGCSAAPSQRHGHARVAELGLSLGDLVGR